MNIIVAIIFGLKSARECIKTHHFEGEYAEIFLWRGTVPLQTSPPLGGDPSPDPTPVGAFGVSIRVLRPPPDHISA